MYTLDVAIIGAGAAGLATAIFAARAAPGLRIAAFDGARAPGAKILVSGGSRCNVTNTIVTESDFNGGRPALIRRVLRALPVAQTIEFFHGLGVPLHEEAGGKLFPDSNTSRDVLKGLLGGLAVTGATLRPAHRVLSVTRRDDGFEVETSQGTFYASAVVLATGGLSLPKTGSDGAGYVLAERLGHSLVPTTPALAPLLFTGSASGPWHAALSGVAQPARLTLRVGGAVQVGITGALLWTHLGISGPAALDMSRHWLRARLDGRVASLAVNLASEERFETIEGRWKELARVKPRATLHAAVAELLPASVAATLLAQAGVPGTRVFADLTKGDRRLVIHMLLDWTLPAGDSRGYAYAEATAGGVPLQEIDPATMESRRCPGLYLVGEILDVDGRLGGFNFQWAWSSAKVAGDALARRGRTAAGLLGRTVG